MNFTWHSLSHRHTTSKLLPGLRGRVFHITSIPNLLDIIKSGQIENNRDGKYKRNWEKNSYFANRGYVSVCDLNNNTAPRLTKKACLSDYNIFSQGKGCRFAYLFLAPEHFSDLVTWKEAQRDLVPGEAVVHNLESGYPCAIQLSQVEEISLIYVNDLGPITQVMEEIYDRRPGSPVSCPRCRHDPG